MKQRYDSYKPSGIDWIGDIPSHWSVVRLKHLIRMKSGDTLSSEQIDPLQGCYPVFGGNGKRGFYSDFNNQGDYVLIGRQGALCGNINYAHEKFWATEHAVVCYPLKSLAILWLGELLRTMNLNQYNVSAAQPGLAVERIKNLLIPVPPLTEQEAIAAWLDDKCGEIDAAIAKVDREIELIDELKQSEISRVVTRGLNPDAHLRPSGIDWIGDIPKHWEVCKVKHKYHIQTGFTPATKNHEYYDLDNGYTWITIGDIKEGTVSESSNKISSKYIEEFAPQPTPKGSLLYSFKLSVGQVSFAGADLYTNEAIASFINSENINLSFLKYSSSLIVNNANINIYGAPILNQELIKNAPIVFPPLSEQQEIADYLDKKCAEIDGLKAKLTKKRETLTELRQSIISEVVTGKRKVI